MAAVGLDATEVASVVRGLAAVLLLAQLAFVADAAAAGEEAAVLDTPSEEALPRVASLLGVADLRSPMCLRRLQVGDEVTLVPRTVAHAAEARDAACKALYGRLFSWLVSRCNERLVDAAATAASIGILDIYGFESFATNSFEQLCINFANERLQQQFNADVLRGEQAEYAEEGLPWTHVDFNDNQPCLDLIDSR